MPTVTVLFERSPSRGVFVRRPLAHWEELLEEWCLVHERYCRLVDDDAIYWNGERPNIAALAAAAWRCGWVALEEFAQPKTEKRSRFSGRTDLYMLSPQSEDYVEAKATEVFASRRIGNSGPFLHAFQTAIVDARNVHLRAGKHKRIGVAFGSVFTRKGDREPIFERIAGVFQNLSAPDFDAAAWCFPLAAQNLTRKDRWGTYLHPGVVLLAKVAS